MLKLGAAIMIFAMSILAAATAMCLGEQSAHAHSSFIHYGNAFSGGVFLTMSLVHLLPEAGDSLRLALGKEVVEDYRVDFMLCILGYALIMTVQRVVFRTPTCPSHLYGDGAHGHSHGGDDKHEHHEHLVGDNDVSVEKSLAALAHSRGSSYGTFSGDITRTSEGKVDAIAQRKKKCDSHSHCEGATHLTLDRNERIAAKRSLGLLLALSLHALGEGVALGLQCGHRNILLFAGAILAHKWAESFALSAHLFTSSGGVYSAQIGRLVLAFSLSTPFGVVAALLTQSQVPASAGGAMKAVSAGTLLYIGASEVVVEEFVQGKQYWAKWFFFICGIALIYFFSLQG
jgi:zinc transporter 1/2/3